MQTNCYNMPMDQNGYYGGYAGNTASFGNKKSNRRKLLLSIAGVMLLATILLAIVSTPKKFDDTTAKGAAQLFVKYVGSDDVDNSYEMLADTAKQYEPNPAWTDKVHGFAPAWGSGIKHMSSSPTDDSTSAETVTVNDQRDKKTAYNISVITIKVDNHWKVLSFNAVGVDR